MKKILINGKFLCQNMTGVQRYAFLLLLGLESNISNDTKNEYEIEVIVPSEPLYEYQAVLQSKRVHIVVKHSVFGHFYWEQIILLFYRRSQILVNLTGSAPVLRKNSIKAIHDMGVVDTPDSYSFLFRIWYKTAQWLNVRNSFCILTVSKFSRNRIIQHYGQKYHTKLKVIYNSLDKKFFKSSGLMLTDLRLDSSFYLVIASNQPRKNLQLIYALARKRPGLHFIIAGALNPRHLKSKGLDTVSNVTHIGRVSDVVLINLYQNCEAIVIPSKYEGFGLPIIEAMAAGAKIVASDIEVFKEVAGDSIIYFTSNNLEDLSNAIDQVPDFNFDYKDILGKFDAEYNASELKNIIDLYQ